MTSRVSKLLRAKLLRESNNPNDSGKNLCTLEVCEALGVDHRVRYLHNMNDMLRALRTTFVVRSRRSSVRGRTVDDIRGQLLGLGAKYYLVGVRNHVLLLGYDGQTIADTVPRKGRDCRGVIELYGIFQKKGLRFRVV